MSGFLSGSAKRLTPQRYVTVLIACAEVKAIVAIVSPMIALGD